MEIRIKDERDEDAKFIGFLTAKDEERQLYLHCKIFIYTDNSMSLEKFMSGKVGKYEFQCNDWERDTLFFKGRGRGRKPAEAEETMHNFLQEVQKEISNKTMEDFREDIKHGGNKNE